MIKRIIQTIFALIFTVLFCLLFFILTTPGLKLGIHLLSNALPGKLTVEKIDGQLINHFDLENIRYIDEKNSYIIQSLHLSWSPLFLFIGKIQIKDFSLISPRFQSEITGSIALLKFFKTHISAISTYSVENYNPIHSTLDIQGNSSSSWTFNFQTTDPFKLQLQGILSPKEIHIDGHWQNVFIPLNKNDSIDSSSGNLSIQGPIDRYAILLDTSLSGTQIPITHWKIAGTGNTSFINLTHIYANLLGGIADGTAKIYNSPHLTWKASLNCKNINPGIQWYHWNGSLNFVINASGRIEKNKKITLFSIPSIKGSINGESALGNIDFAIENKKIIQGNSNLTLGSNILHLSFNLHPQWNILWNIHAPNLSEIFPSSMGSVISAGQITVEKNTPHIQASAQLNHVISNFFNAEQLYTTANIQLNDNEKTSLSLSGKNIQWNQYFLTSVNVLGKGTALQHEITAEIIAKNSRMNIALTGKYSKNGWNGSLHHLDLSSSAYHDWHLKNSVQLFANSSQITLSPFCWQSNAAANICGNFSKDAEQWNLVITSQQFPLSLLEGFYPEPLKIDTLVHTDIALSQIRNKPVQGHIILNTSEGKVLYIEPHIAMTEPINFDTIEFTADFQKTLVSQFIVKANNQTPIKIQFNLPEYEKEYSHLWQQKISGSLQISFDSLSQLQALIPQISHTNGSFNAHLIFSDTLKDLSINGNASLKNASTSIYAYDTDTDINNFSLTLLFKKRDVDIQGEGVADSGKFKITGKGSTRSPYKIALRFQSNPWNIKNEDEYQIAASPDLNLTFIWPSLSIDGDITIPQANVSYVKFETITRLPINTSIIRKDEQTVTKKWLQLFMNIKVKLGNAIHLDIRGLSGNLLGQLNIQLKPDTPITATGELTIKDGVYEIYGEKLNIDRGRLLFSGGPINNPGLDIQASKTTKQAAITTPTNNLDNISHRPDITTLGINTLLNMMPGSTQQVVVGIKVSGTQQDPIISLFSIPGGLTNADILSYLLTGAPSDQTNMAQGQLLSVTSSAVGSNKNSSTSNIQRSIGLSEVGFETTTVINTKKKLTAPQQNTSFVLGKYLTPRIYLQASMGILIPVNIFDIRYLLTQRLSIQAETSSIANSMDLFYFYEK